MTIRFGNTVLRIFLAITLAFGPFGAWAQSSEDKLRLIIESNLQDSDSTRFVVDMGEMPIANLAQAPEKMGEHADILPKPGEALKVHVFVPAQLEADLRQKFVEDVEEQFKTVDPSLRVEIVTVELDVSQAQIEQARANARIEAAEAELQKSGEGQPVVAQALTKANNRKLKDLVDWAQGFGPKAKEYFHWKKRIAAVRGNLTTPYTKEKHLYIGGLIGIVRAGSSLMVWSRSNGWSMSTAFQVPMSAFLDFVFSKYEQKIDQWKSTHRIPLEKMKGIKDVPGIKHFVRWYNDSPYWKSWIIGNLIGAAASFYFRFWSYVADPERTSSPFSLEAGGTFSQLFLLGQVTGPMGAMAPRILRKKGYINSTAEYYIYSSYGFVFQLNGWFFGLGWDSAALSLAYAESMVKAIMYGAARWALPSRGSPRALVLHPAFFEREVEEILFRSGLYSNELHAAEKPDFAELVKNLKAEQSLTLKDRFNRRFAQVKQLFGCESALETKDPK